MVLEQETKGVGLAVGGCHVESGVALSVREVGVCALLRQEVVQHFVLHRP